MKKVSLVLSVAALALGSAVPALAVTATSLSSFGGIEEPSDVVYRSGTSLLVRGGDSYVNITDRTGGRFRMLLRYYQGNWCDGDRTTGNTSMQRAEVKVLGTRQLRGQTFTYSSSWRTNNAYTFATTNTCAINQVKATDGDNSQALSTTFLTSQTAGRIAHGAGTGMTTVRTFSYTAGTSKTIAIRIKISSSSGSTDGAFHASISGDSFQGISNVKMERPGSTTYQPKWGLYRSIGNLNIARTAEEYVEHASVQANRL